MSRKPKYIFVTGGVLSGLGKGITAASLGNVLKAGGFNINIQKVDPYLNRDAGTLNPGEHGEVFVTDDGAEADLDLGHYERFLNQNLTHQSSVMTGKIYETVFRNERQGKYLGQTVQIIPHVTNEVKHRIRTAAQASGCDIHIIEIGGTIGDNEGFHFIEAARQMWLEEREGNILFVHVVFLPYLRASDEVKTKPAQHSVEKLRSIGIQPHLLIARADDDIPPTQIAKLSLYTNVEKEAILPLPTVDTVYEIPLIMEHYRLHEIVAQKLGLQLNQRNGGEWTRLVKKIKEQKPTLTIALVGKYTTMLDTYASVVEALKAACWQAGVDLNLRWIDSEQLEQQAADVFLKDAAGIVVPGGFGSRGIEGKIAAVKYARENKIPYLGLCLGMQLAVIEFARNVAGIPQATSEEFVTETPPGETPKGAGKTLGVNGKTPSVKEAPSCVIHIMDSQKTITDKGGTMRLGGWDCRLTPGSFAHQAYKQKQIRERHRHRYELNNDFREQLEKAGLRIAGTTPDGALVEIVEVADHPWFVGVQYHAEFTSRPLTGHPLFNDFVKAATAKVQL